MVQFKTSLENVQEWFPKTLEAFINELRSSKSKSSDIELSNIDWIISWGFFVKKAQTDEESMIRQIEFTQKLEMKYFDRIKVEIPKIRVNLTFKAGNYIKTDRVIDLDVPVFILDMANEVIKITMVQEQMQLNDFNVIDSLKEFDYLFIEDNQEQLQNEKLDMDSILDKISESGMQSLSKNELMFLEKMSSGK